MKIMKVTNKIEANVSIISTKSMNLRYLCGCTCVTIVQLTVHPCRHVYIYIFLLKIFVLFSFHMDAVSGLALILLFP
jgi:hypothetical protein